MTQTIANKGRAEAASAQTASAQNWRYRHNREGQQHPKSEETMKKLYAIRKVNSHLGERLLKDSRNDSNTHFSNKINKSAEQKVWWFNILPQRFGNDLHLLCAKNPGLIWLRIKANTFPNPEIVFRLRSDKGVIDLEIAADGDRYLKDLKSGGTGYDFRPHIEYEWNED